MAAITSLAQLLPLPSERDQPLDNDTAHTRQLPSSAASYTTTGSHDAASLSSPATSLGAPRSRSSSPGLGTKQLAGLTLEDAATTDAWPEHDSFSLDGGADKSETSIALEVVDAVGLAPKKLPQRRRASTTLLMSHDDDEIRQILGDDTTGTALVKKCCGGGCTRLSGRRLPLDTPGEFVPVKLPDNPAFKSLALESRLRGLALNSILTGVVDLPKQIMSFEALSPEEAKESPPSTVDASPPSFVQPHPPYHVYSAPVHHARELTKPGAQKRTVHLDIDVTDYPEEISGVDFKVGGAIGVCPRNQDSTVDDIFDCLGVLKFVRDQPIMLHTGPVRWPTIWGDEVSRKLNTSRRELLTWCVDIQSTSPTKQVYRVLAEHASDQNERKILMYLASETGQESFCTLRTGPHITLSQLLHAFPTSTPPLPLLLSVLTQLMPRFYSLSNDPDVSSARAGLEGKRKLIEIAVTVHEDTDWKTGIRLGVGSGFMSRLAQEVIDAEAEGRPRPVVSVPMFRGLMANPLSREFATEGPMLLVGAGVGVAPFRGFILNRLRYANCANKVWLIQGIRDASLDQLYEGELGPDDNDRSIKHLVQSRRTDRQKDEARYVQDEVRFQADTVWDVITAADGRVCVCGSSKGMGEGVEEALIDVACLKGRLNRDQAVDFWRSKKESGQYVTVSFLHFSPFFSSSRVG